MRLETARLILRPWEDRDRVPLAAIRGDPVVRRFYQSVATPEETNRIIDDAALRMEMDGFHFGAAELKADGSLIGMIGIGRLNEEMAGAIPGRPQVEIGWQLDKRFWGRGLAPEGARAWLQYGWESLELAEIVAFTARINLPSQRVMQKIGMSHNSADDFEHPNLPEGHALRPHVLYRIGNPNRFSPASPQ